MKFEFTHEEFNRTGVERDFIRRNDKRLGVTLRIGKNTIHFEDEDDAILLALKLCDRIGIRRMTDRLWDAVTNVLEALPENYDTESYLGKAFTELYSAYNADQSLLRGASK